MKNESMIGKEILVMIEGKVADENAYVGRSYRDAPDIDGLDFCKHRYGTGKW